jgi:uncharacterized membrane protein YsdA (DUF1294 family)
VGLFHFCGGPVLIKYVLILLAALNLASFFAYWIDKTRARRSATRISEARLLQLSFLGPIGSIPGIWWIRHKTHKTSYLVKYSLVLLVSLAVHSAAIWWAMSGD